MDKNPISKLWDRSPTYGITSARNARLCLRKWAEEVTKVSRVTNPV
jgi:hypothetical protein